MFDDSPFSLPIQCFWAIVYRRNYIIVIRFSTERYNLMEMAQNCNRLMYLLVTEFPVSLDEARSIAVSSESVELRTNGGSVNLSSSMIQLTVCQQVAPAARRCMEAQNNALAAPSAVNLNKHARARYASLGFQDAGPYSDHPTPGATYLKLPPVDRDDSWRGNS